MVIYYNETFVEEGQGILPATDRSFRYGDGLFESMVCFLGRIPLLPLHYERLYRSAEILQITMPDHFSYDWLKDTLVELLSYNHYSSARIRIQVSRGGEGLYLPTTGEASILIESQPITHTQYEWSSIRAVYAPYRVDTGVLSNLKTTSKIQYVMSALHADKMGAQEALLFNTKGFLAEAIHSNIFLIKDGKLYTPTLINGGVNGVMRRYLMALLENEFEIIQGNYYTSDIDEADELFLTNGVRGIQSLAVVGETVYTDSVTKRIFEKVNDDLSKTA